MTSELSLESLDLGIRKLVEWLRSHGFRTTDSGDGRSKFATGVDECALPFPHVVMTVDPGTLESEADRLAELLRDEHQIECQPTGEGEHVPQISASYGTDQLSPEVIKFPFNR